MTTAPGNRARNTPYGKSLTEALEFWWREQVKDLYTAMPGVIVDYDGAKRRATVLPALDIITADGSAHQRPLVANVPVLTPGGGGWTMLLPLQRGDPVLLLFCMRGIAYWKRHHADGVPVRSEHPTPGDLLDLNDAIALPCFGPAGALPGEYPDGVVFPTATAPDGPLYIGRQRAESGDDARHLLLENDAVRLRAQNGEVELDAGNGTPVKLTLSSAGITATVGGATLTITASEASYTDGSDSLALLAHKRAYDAHILAYNAHVQTYGGHTHNTPAGPSGGPS